MCELFGSRTPWLDLKREPLAAASTSISMNSVSEPLLTLDAGGLETPTSQIAEGARVRRSSVLLQSNTDKRQKQDVSSFKPGNVIKVTVTNFTTYSYAEFSLSPRLNMIIGPNGTGKSTLVAAICLGLGGKLDLIKRKHLKSMIKSGELTSELCITLMDKNHDPLEIVRTFDEASSVWKINGRKVSEKQVISTVTDLNIQLDNLCHFLPQERVAEFASLSPEKLLLEMERTLKSGDLYLMHKNLIDLEKTREQALTQLQKLLDSLTSLKEEQAVLSAEVERLNTFEEKIKDLKYHKLLLPYAISNDEKAKKKALKVQRDDAKRKLDELSSRIEPIQKQVVLTEMKVSEMEEAAASARLQLDSATDEYKAGDAKISKLRKKIDESSDVLRKARISRDTIKKEIEVLNKQLLEDQDQLKAVGDVDTDHDMFMAQDEKDHYVKSRKEKNQELEELRNRNEEISDVIEAKKGELRRIQFQQKEEAGKLNNKDKLSLINPNSFNGGNISNNNPVAMAYYLHRELRKVPEFQKHYFEAPVVTCEVTKRSLAGIVEKIIGFNTLLSLTFVSEESYRAIPKSVLDKFNAPTRIAKSQAPESMIPKDKLSFYGFTGYLSDCIVGPKEVLNMLNLNAKINQIPYASSLTDQQFKRILEPGLNGRIPFMKFAVDNELFTVSRSKYGSKQFVYSSETISGARFFGKQNAISEDFKKRINKLLEDLKHQENLLQNEITKAEKEKERVQAPQARIMAVLKELEDEIRRIDELLFKKQKYERRIQDKELLIRRKKKELNVNQNNTVKKHQSKILEYNTQLAEQTASSLQAIQRLGELEAQLNHYSLQKLYYSDRKKSILELIREIDTYKVSLETIYQEASQKYRDARESEATKQIREQKKHYTEEEERDLATLAKQYLEEGNLHQVIVQSKIDIMEEELSIMSAATDRNSIAMLKQVGKSIEEAEQKLPQLERNKQSYDERIENIRSSWEPELSGLVQEISNAFKSKFISVASDGEVQLKRLEKFEDWRLEILVKFREESELKVLDRQSQSGGERAVSTIFFVMALQGLTLAPLRIVDEINQGMDPKNEKLAHKYLVHTASMSSDSQYFLVTPKLLTGLYYHPSMKIHCIFTGPLIDPFKKSDTDFMDFSNLY